MESKTPWIGTSWKMNKTRAQARAYAEALKASRVIATTTARPFVIPPFTAIADVAAILEGGAVRVGAQNMHWADAGAWTGEISPAMIRDVGATLVEIGHSERRMHFGETDETVALKVRAALAHGLIPLVCVGDTRQEYEVGATSAVLAKQVRSCVQSAVGPQETATASSSPMSRSGRSAKAACPPIPISPIASTPLIKEECAGLRHAVPVDVVYGGSVNPDNCRELTGKTHIDGLFIGRSAWEAQGYIGIVESVMAALEP